MSIYNVNLSIDIKSSKLHIEILEPSPSIGRLISDGYQQYLGIKNNNYDDWDCYCSSVDMDDEQ